MRAIEFLTELFQQGKDWKWEFKGSEEAMATFTVGDVEYFWHASVENIRRPNQWTIAFRARNQSEQDKMFGLTGTGNSAEVMSTAIDITRSFLQEYGDKVLELRFSAKEESRSKLYARMVKRLLPNWDLHTMPDVLNGGSMFYLTNPRAYELAKESGVSAGGGQHKWMGKEPYRHLVEKNIDESIDLKNAFPIEEWYENEQEAVIAVAHDSLGKEIEVIFTPLHDEINAIDFDFTRGGTYEKTGEGDAQRVFATVLNAFNQYLNSYYEPDYIAFGSKGDSRTRLYSTMIKRFASKFGYKEIPYDSLPKEITDQPRPEGHMFALAKSNIQQERPQ